MGIHHTAQLFNRGHNQLLLILLNHLSTEVVEAGLIVCYHKCTGALLLCFVCEDVLFCVGRSCKFCFLGLQFQYSSFQENALMQLV